MKKLLSIVPATLILTAACASLLFYPRLAGADRLAAAGRGHE